MPDNAIPMRSPRVPLTDDEMSAILAEIAKHGSASAKSQVIRLLGDVPRTVWIRRAIEARLKEASDATNQTKT